MSVTQRRSQFLIQPTQSLFPRLHKIAISYGTHSVVEMVITIVFIVKKHRQVIIMMMMMGSRTGPQAV